MDSEKDDINMKNQSLEKESEVGPIIGLVIVVLVLVASAIFVWLDRPNGQDVEVNESNITENNTDNETLSDTLDEKMTEQSDSDAIESIEKDILDTNIETIDEELNQIEIELI